MSKVVGNYLLRENIGLGQFGVVRKAEHRHTKEIVAVKVMMNKHFKNEPRLNELLANEVSTLTKLSHPNVVKYIETIQTANNVYLVFEYCNEGTLDELIKSKKRLSVEEAMDLMIQIRNGYEAICEENIVHRDLKPNNILFHNKVLKIADFGFCKELSGNKMAETLVGSPIYMAPEILLGMQYDARADLWSIGVILYEMLYGCCPYQQTTIPKLIFLIETTEINYPPYIPVPEKVIELLKKLLCKDFKERIKPREFLNYNLDLLYKEEKSPTKRQHNIEANKLIKSSNLEKNSNLESKNNIKIIRKSEAKESQMSTKENKNESILFIRKALSYLASTIYDLTKNINQTNILRVTFLVFKILKVFLIETKVDKMYWILLKKKEKNKDISSQWDDILNEELKSGQEFEEYIKKALENDCPSINTELESTYVDVKYFYSLITNIKNSKIKENLLNCLLLYRHYILIIEEKEIDFMNYENHSIEEKEELCVKFISYF